MAPAQLFAHDASSVSAPRRHEARCRWAHSGPQSALLSPLGTSPIEYRAACLQLIRERGVALGQKDLEARLRAQRGFDDLEDRTPKPPEISAMSALALR